MNNICTSKTSNQIRSWLFDVLVLTHVLQHSCGSVLVFEAEWVEALSASKVNDLYSVEVGHHDVVWLEVQVEDAPIVEVLDPLEDLDQVTHHVVLGVTEPLSEEHVKKFDHLKGREMKLR